jgi:ABC-2 type transport system permease protein
MSAANRYLILARREVWERRSLWLAPVALAGLLLTAATFGALRFGNGVRISTDHPMPITAAPYAGQWILLVTVVAIGIFAGVVAWAYLLDCLYAERRDRSILFWKSLPVSDTETVLTKFVVALVLVPLFVLALALVLQPLLIGIAALRVPTMRPHVLEMIGAGIGTVPRLLGIGVFEFLWYAPVAAYVMLASVLARRAPFVYAVVPPLALVTAESLLSGTGYVAHFLQNRLMPWQTRGQLLLEHGPNGMATLSRGTWHLLQDPQVWFGAIAAAAMLVVVIRLRRYRDDT